MADAHWQPSTDDLHLLVQATRDARPGLAQDAPAPVRAGASLGPYRLSGLLGEGSMGSVFHALDTRTDREVALKIPKLRHGRGRSERALREGDATAALDHPGIVRLIEHGVVDGLPYLAYELILGVRTYADVAHDLSLERRVALVRDAARAMGHAHSRGVVHRDLKPENLFVDAGGRVRVADFGLAMLTSTGIERLTQSGVVLGTPRTMAPEQITGKRAEVGPHTDVWALGVVLYWALTGEYPFLGDSLIDLATRIVSRTPPSPRELEGQVPAHYSDVCMRALTRSPAGRYADGDALADALDVCLAGGAMVELSPVTPAHVVGVLAFVLLLGAAAWWVTPQPPPPPKPPASPAAPTDEVEVARLRVLAEAQMGRKEYALAATTCGRILALAPEQVDVICLRAIARDAAGDLLGAKEDFERAVAQAPDRPGPFRERARFLAKQGNMAAARRDLGRAIELEPDAPQNYILAAQFHCTAGEWEQALPVIQRAVDLGPEQPSGHHGKALILVQLGKKQAALDSLDEAIRLDGGRQPQYRADRALARLAVQDIAGALEDYEVLIASRRNAQDFTNAGAIYLGQGRLGRALEVLNQALDLEPENPKALLSRGEVHFSLGDTPSAIRDWTLSLRVMPEDGPARPRIEARLEEARQKLRRER